ncbi:MAG: TonB family protein [Chloracidobacterium sp.]|nr:TonB family protein [Chloracidobacterium sp.]MDW8216850.1 TonB family protein [Acidobacteriota bacterium]
MTAQASSDWKWCVTGVVAAGWLGLASVAGLAQGSEPGTRPTVQQLAAQLASPETETRLRAVLTLRKLGAAAAPAAAELVKALRDEDPRVAEQAMWALAFVGAPGLAAVPTLTAMVRDVDEPNRVTAAAVLGLLKTGDAEAVAALVEATRSSDSELRRAAALALGALGSAALPGVAPLARLTGDPNGEVRQAAVTALGRLGGYAAPALPTLRALATGDDAALRGPAAAAVKRIEGELARPVQPTPSAFVLTPTPAAGRVEASPVDSPPKPLESPLVQPTPERVEAASATNAGGGVTAGAPTTRTGVVILAQDKPRYTPEAAAQRLTGVVVVRVEFRADGRIGEVKLVSGLGGGLDQEALRAARSIRFTPAQESGRPVTTTMDIKYRFVWQ